MDLEFRQQSVGETTYLVLDLEDQPAIDVFAMQMMAHNRLTSIIQTQIVQINDRKQIQLNVTGLAKLNNRISVPRPKKEVLGILNSILNAFEEVDVYMLDMNHLFLDWEHVYIDGQENCMLMYLPFDHAYDKDKMVFLQEIVSKIQPDYQEKDPYLFDILNAFSRGAIQKLADFREIIKKSASVPAVDNKADVNKPDENRTDENKEKKIEAKPQRSGSSVIAAVPKPQEKEEKPAPVAVKKVEKKATTSSRLPVINIPGREPGAKEVPEKKKKGFFRSAKAEPVAIPGKENKHKDNGMRGSSPMRVSEHVTGKQDDMYESYEHTVVMQEPRIMPGKSDVTVVLDQPDNSMRISARLIRKQNGAVYKIDQEKAMVGSGSSANICIFDNKAISRSHAVIIRVDKNYYIEDNQSRNGSFVNGKRLQPGVREPIYDGMTLRFANEDFDFVKDS